MSAIGTFQKIDSIVEQKIPSWSTTNMFTVALKKVLHR